MKSLGISEHCFLKKLPDPIQWASILKINSGSDMITAPGKAPLATINEIRTQFT